MIKIEKKDENTFLVEVDQDGLTKHEVTVDPNYYKKLTKDRRLTTEDLIKKSFEFLLERESNQSILKKFNLEVIQQYFPEYESEISK
jgi:hypothetical protein